MDRQKRAIIDLAVQVLREAMIASGEQRCDTTAVRLALRSLLPHCPERWPLTTFWESAGQENEIGRAQGCTAAFNGIIRQLRRSGAWSDLRT
ncbi:hypothetical protein QE363_000727 [Sphingomonas sp. SORGH_AS870]|uniref:hypothetical protein n=1 Tax=Sphingomonas sp. SORGH_AS_0870 TaxID=3041801 RepID=UPI0028556742|nr:hypothetical protein [Sphingomonas sp. SORGH_AS_0870]MDR6144934.1 hypothetical protein [Sphingomonas sp. SORGH_AS_0870]